MQAWVTIQTAPLSKPSMPSGFRKAPPSAHRGSGEPANAMIATEAEAAVSHAKDRQHTDAERALFRSVLFFGAEMPRRGLGGWTEALG